MPADLRAAFTALADGDSALADAAIARRCWQLLEERTPLLSDLGQLQAWEHPAALSVSDSSSGDSSDSTCCSSSSGSSWAPLIKQYAAHAQQHGAAVAKLLGAGTSLPTDSAGTEAEVQEQGYYYQLAVEYRASKKCLLVDFVLWQLAVTTGPAANSSQ